MGVPSEMELLARTATEAGKYVASPISSRTVSPVPHATWEETSQMFSTFLSNYNQAMYESEMLAVTHNARDAKAHIRDAGSLRDEAQEGRPRGRH